jgi:hypothetical protein
MEKIEIIGTVARISERRTTAGDTVHQIEVTLATGGARLVYTPDTRVVGELRSYLEFSTNDPRGRQRQRRSKRGLPVRFECKGEPLPPKGSAEAPIDSVKTPGVILAIQEAPEARASSESDREGRRSRRRFG